MRKRVGGIGEENTRRKYEGKMRKMWRYVLGKEKMQKKNGRITR